MRCAREWDLRRHIEPEPIDAEAPPPVDGLEDERLDLGVTEIEERRVAPAPVVEEARSGSLVVPPEPRRIARGPAVSEDVGARRKRRPGVRKREVENHPQIHGVRLA